MNKVFKTVWNASLGVWVAVSETAAGQKKGSNKLKKAAANAVATVVVGAAAVASTGAIAYTNGYGAVSGAGSIAIGSSSGNSDAQAKQQGAVAIGEGAQALDIDAVSIGKESRALISGNIAIGASAQAVEESTIAIGSSAYASKKQSIAIGESANSNGESSTSLGFSAQAEGDNATTIGASSQAGKNSTAIGASAKATGEGSIAIGQNVTAAKNQTIGINGSALAEKSIAIGSGSKVESTGSGSVSIGFANTVRGENTFVLGSRVSTVNTLVNSVILGNQSTLANVYTQDVVSKVDYQYRDPAGNLVKEESIDPSIVFQGMHTTNSAGAVSVGAKGAERQIQHVGAGRITALSTDAVNGSQLYYVLSEAKQAQADAAKPINFVTVDQDGKPVIGDVYVFDTDGKVQLDAAGNPVTQKGPLSAQVQLGDTFNIQGAKVTIGEDGNPVLTVDAAAASAWKLATGGDVANASTIGGETNVVDFVGGKNAEVSQTVLTDATGKPIGTQLTVEVADQIELTENGGLTIAGVPQGNGPITINQGNVNFGGNVISGVAPGVAGTDAVNVDQLKGSGWGLGNATVLDVDGNVVTDANNQPVTTAKINPDDQVEHKAGPSNNVTVNTTVQKVELTDENGQVVLDANGQPVLVDKATVTVDLADKIALTDKGGLTIAATPAQPVVDQDGNPVTDADGNPVYQAGNGAITIQQGNVSFGGNQLKDVAAGTELTDGVNVSQLKDAVDTLGGGATVNPDGTIKAPSYTVGTGNQVVTTVGDAIDVLNQGFTLTSSNASGAADEQIQAGDTIDITVTKENNNLVAKQDGSSIEFALADQIALTDKGGLTIGAGQGQQPIVIQQGNVNLGGNKLENIAAGTAPTDAVNVSQLQSAGWNVITQDKDAAGNVTGTTENAVNGDKAANNSSVQFNGDDNISVSQTSKDVVDADGNVVGSETIIAVELDKDVDLSADGSLTIGNTLLNDAGLTLAGATVGGKNYNPIIINQGNVNFGGNVLGGVAAGVADDDAVNVSQLKDEIGKAVGDSGWTLTTGGVAAADGEKIKPSTTVDFSGDDIGNIQVSNEGSNVKVELNPNLNLGEDGSVTIGDTLLNGNGLTVGDTVVDANGLTVGDITIQEGNVNFAGNQINNVGTATQDDQAVNLGQLKDELGGLENTINKNIDESIANSGWNLTGTDAAGNTVSEKVNPNDTVEFVAGPSGNTTVTTETTPNGAKVTVDINDQLNLTGDAGSLTIGAGKGNDAITIQQGNVSVGGNQIHNLAAGTAGTDAVNVDQLKGTINIFGGGAAVNPDGSIQAPTYNVNGGSYNNVGEALGALNQADIDLGDRVTNLQQSFNNRIDDVEDRMSAGIAAAMALETAPYVPGKYTYAAATAYHNGQAALGVTLRKTADNGRWSLTGGVAAGTEGDPSVRLGVSGIID